MKLSQLVNYKNQLDALSAIPVKKQADQRIEEITHLVENQPMLIGDFANLLQKNRLALQDSFDKFEHDFKELKLQLQELITTSEKPWFQESYKVYEQGMMHETTDYILDRRPVITNETEQFYRSRIVRYNNWQYPSMIIRPGRETFINELLASDPLYLVDISHDLLVPALGLFNEQYQNRLRTYTINETRDQEILSKLPNGQFGLVFAYNFFNFKPFEIIRKYFIEIYQKLRPGGMLVMTFNDCDRDKGVMLVEQHFCCYTPGYLVRELAQSVGFEVTFSWTDEGPSTWLELKKPGEFKTLRGGQALAKILPK